MCSNRVEHSLNDRIRILETRKSVRQKYIQNPHNFTGFTIGLINFNKLRIWA